MKKPYLVVHDYGMGGAWAYLLAESRAEISKRFPQLKVVDKPPGFLSENDLARIRSRMSIDIDDEGNEFLRALKTA